MNKVLSVLAIVMLLLLVAFFVGLPLGIIFSIWSIVGFTLKAFVFLICISLIAGIGLGLVAVLDGLRSTRERFRSSPE